MKARSSFRPSPLQVEKAFRAGAATCDVLPTMHEEEEEESDDESHVSALSRTSSEDDLFKPQGRQVSFSPDRVQVETIFLDANGYEEKPIPKCIASPRGYVGSSMGVPAPKLQDVACKTAEARRDANSLRRAEDQARKYGAHGQWKQGIKGKAQTMPELPSLVACERIDGVKI
mmetsp:Transcript_85126/g.150563  ORF Transcript_85126/g.150563 Transcript_85126/m.150563 type:complete len:173 (-) Transcript_85126:40-558(-)